MPQINPPKGRNAAWFYTPLHYNHLMILYELTEFFYILLLNTFLQEQRECKDRKDILDHRVRVAKGKEKNHFRNVANRAMKWDGRYRLEAAKGDEIRRACKVCYLILCRTFESMIYIFRSFSSCRGSVEL